MYNSRLTVGISRLVSGVTLCLLASCAGPYPVPLGNWQSTLGRADIRFVEKDSGSYSAIVSHRTAEGGVCPIEYPLVRTHYGLHIQAEGRILVSFDPEKDKLFLSPGGTYIRKADAGKGLPEYSGENGQLRNHKDKEDEHI